MSMHQHIPPGHGASGRRGGNTPVVALAVAIVVAVAGFGGWWLVTQNRDGKAVPQESLSLPAPTGEAPPVPDPESAEPSSSQAPPSESTAPRQDEATPRDEQSTQRQPGSGDGDGGGAGAPPLPKEFGEFTTSYDPDEVSFLLYSAPGSRHIGVEYLKDSRQVERKIDQLRETEQLGIWVCGLIQSNTPDDPACVAEAHGGGVIVISHNTDTNYADVQEIGNDLLDVWGR